MSRRNPLELRGGAFSLAGKTALVTGGSGGIGFMIAQGLLTAGARVAISSRKAERCDSAAAELAECGECIAIPADVSSRPAATALAGAVSEAFGGELDVLVNNAGATWGAPVDDFPDDGWDKVLDTNLTGVFALTTALLPALRARASSEEPARVINIGSVDGIRPSAMDNYPYSASKAAVHMLTRHLARRLAPESITVNALAPGPFESRMTAFLLDDPDDRATLERSVPLGRIGQPDDIAGAAVFLASRAGAYLTGAVIPVDGGMSGCP